MLPRVLTSVCLPAAFVLSGCEGSESITTLSDVLALNDAFESNLDATSVDNYPTGTATYTGAALAAVVDDAAPDDRFQALGETSLTANFDDGTIAGTASNFYELSDLADTDTDSFEVLETVAGVAGASIDGEIEIEMSQFIDGQPLFVGTAEGELTDTDGTMRNFDFSNVIGGFNGDAAEQFVAEAGGVAGGVTSTLSIYGQQ